jgi:hypothetical protein
MRSEIQREDNAMLPPTHPSLPVRIAIAAVLVFTLFPSTPASAREPHHVVASIDGYGGATLAVTHARVGDLDRYAATNVTFGVNRVHTRGEVPEQRESACVSTETYWLPADGSSEEYLAVKSEVGCVTTDGAVDIDTRDLTYARLPVTGVTLELQYCFAQPGWESICDGAPSQRSVSISVELSGVGELIAHRGRDRYEVPFAPECVELQVFYNAWRDGGGTMWIDGAANTVDPYLTFIFDGELFFNLLCRQ